MITNPFPFNAYYSEDEGWSAIGQWSGPRFSDFLQRVGADLTARYVGFKNPKHVVALFVTNEDPGGYWEDKGYNWFSGS